MKKTCIAILFAALAMWAGISIGYRDGVREERLRWEATAQSDRDGTVTLKNEPASLSVQSASAVYRNPHFGIVRVVYAGKPMVNVPDPRTYQQFESSRP
jgi:hypothetical protein